MGRPAGDRCLVRLESGTSSGEWKWKHRRPRQARPTQEMEGKPRGGAGVTQKEGQPQTGAAPSIDNETIANIPAKKTGTTGVTSKLDTNFPVASRLLQSGLLVRAGSAVEAG